MGHWVTLDDDQHVYISDSGKVLATRGAISSSGGGKDRGKVMAARSKAAIGKATAKTTRAIEHAKAAGPSSDTVDRQFKLHQKQGWGSYKDVGEERKDAATHASIVHAKAVENIAKWKKEGAPAGTAAALAKAEDQAEKALAKAKALGALKGARAKHYATLKAVKLMQRSVQR